mmetsp:Transcript_297/g.576  ORF Transcript_297/g.576 Transcript_297/m.576 type:complete len:200 (+) Transcript_297:210-809(+)
MTSLHPTQFQGPRRIILQLLHNLWSTVSYPAHESLVFKFTELEPRFHRARRCVDFRLPLLAIVAFWPTRARFCIRHSGIAHQQMRRACSLLRGNCHKENLGEMHFGIFKHPMFPRGRANEVDNQTSWKMICKGVREQGEVVQSLWRCQSIIVGVTNYDLGSSCLTLLCQSLEIFASIGMDERGDERIILQDGFPFGCLP